MLNELAIEKPQAVSLKNNLYTHTLQYNEVAISLTFRQHQISGFKRGKFRNKKELHFTLCASKTFIIIYRSLNVLSS